MNSLEELREAFSDIGLTRKTAADDPVEQFGLWYAQAEEAGIPEPNGMVLSTATDAGAPSQRTVLLKGFDQTGFTFYTNHSSRKARQMATNASVSALMPWYPLHRQIIIEGRVSRLTRQESEEYFHSRPRGSQLGAWASRQSEVLSSRHELETRLARIEERFGDGEIPLPDFWGGYLITPHRFEFWQGRTHRLHDRIVYERADNGSWETSRLSP